MRFKINFSAGAALAACLLALLTAGELGAAVPGRVSYQGTLRKSGVLFNGTAPMEFTVTSADGGQLYWTSGSTDVVVSGGLFRYQLGSPNEIQFAAIPWGDVVPYVQVKVDGGWLPREPLYSTPYALHAYSAEIASGTFTAYDGDIRISTSAGSYGIVFQDGTVQRTASGLWAVSGANISYAPGSIGVGVANPQARLDVQAAAAGYPQIWRNSSGVVQSSMSAAGVLYADGSGLRNLSVAGDNLGSHTATRALDMAGFQVLGVSSLTVTGAQGVSAGKLTFSPPSYISNAAPSQHAGLYISTNVYLPAGAKYYGDGSALTGISGGSGGGGDNLGNHILAANLVAGPYWFSGDGDPEGVSVDANGNVGVGISGAGAARLDVSGSVGNYIQIWRNNSGVIQASMTATGILYADASRMRNLPSGDNLGSHTATQTLNLASNDIINVSTISVSSITSPGSAVVFSKSISVAGLTGGSNRCVYVDAGGVLRAKGEGSDCGLSGVTGDNLGDYTMTQNLKLGSNWLSNDGGANGLTVSPAGNVGAGLSGAAARLDVQGAAGDTYVQLWRNSSGVIQASMTAAGVLYADASQMRNLPSGADNLGSHTATKDLNLASFNIVNVSSVNFRPGVSVSSAAAAQLGGVYVSSNVYIVGVASATKYYGDGSALSGITGAADNLGNHTATQALNLASNDIINVSTISVSSITSPGSAVVFGKSISVAGLTGGSNRCVYVDAGGVLRAKGEGSDCGLSGVTGDNLGNYTMTQNLKLGSNWLSNDGGANGLTVSPAGNVGAGVGVAATRLDVQGAAGDAYVQLWRNSSGVIQASMTAAGVLYADASQMRNLPSGADNLGNHTATQNLNLASHDLVGVSTISAGYLTSPGTGVTFSTNVFITDGNLGIHTSAPQERLHVDGNILSSNLSGADNRCVYVDAQGVLRAKGSDCGIASPTGDNLGNHTLTQNLILGANWLSPDGSSKGITVDSGGNVGIGKTGPGARLDVKGAVGNYIQLWRDASDVIQASMTLSGVLYADGSKLRNLPSGADNLGNHTLTQNLVIGSNWLSNHGENKGLAVDSNGNVGIGLNAPVTVLDLQPATGDAYAQVWRNSSGVIQASMTASGILYADASQMRNLPSGADNLGNHTATRQLDMNNYAIWSSSDVTAARYQIGGSTVLAVLPGAGSLGVGPGAGMAATGIANTFVGVNAGSSTVAGTFNSVFGYQAGRSNTTGSFNALIGGNAGRANVSGGSNVIIGNGAGVYNVTGSANVLLGGGAGAGAAGNSYSSSTVVGYRAGFGLTTGGDNILLGWQAGDAITTGADNIVIGYNQDASAPAAANELNIGGVLFGDLAGKTIGISTRVPQAALDIVSTGTLQTQFAQIWRDGGGAIKSSMSATGVLMAAKFVGDASGLTGVTDQGAVRRAGDTMTGPLTLNGSTLTVTGNSFSVTGASFMVAASGNVGVGVPNPVVRLEVNDNDGNAATSGMKFDNFSCTGTDKLTADASGNVVCAPDQTGSGSGNIIDTLYDTLGAGSDAGGRSILNAGNSGFGLASAATRLDVQPAGGDAYSQIWRDATGVIQASMTASGLLYADGSKLRNLPSGADNLGNHTATRDLDLAGFRLLNVSTLTAAGGQPGVMVAGNALVDGDLYAAGRTRLGNLSTNTDASRAVTAAHSFVPSAGVYNNYLLWGHAEADPAADMNGAPAHTLYGGYFESVVKAGNPNKFSALAGVSGLAAHFGSNSLDTAYGVLGVAGGMATGPVGTAYGGFFGAGAGMSGVYDNVIVAGYGVYAQNAVYTGASQMTNSYAFYAQTPNSLPGRITNNYGVYINDQSGMGSAQNFNLYSAGSFSRNFFGGSVGIGTQAPAASLHISSAAGYAGDLVLISTGSSDVIRMTGSGEVHATKFFGDGSGLTGVAGGTGMSNPANADFDANGRNINNAAVVRAGGVVTDEIATFGQAVTISTNVIVSAVLGIQGNVVIGAAPGGEAPLEIMANPANNVAIKLYSSGGAYCKLLISDVATCDPPFTGSTLLGTNKGKALCLQCGP